MIGFVRKGFLFSFPHQKKPPFSSSEKPFFCAFAFLDSKHPNSRTLTPEPGRYNMTEADSSETKSIVIPSHHPTIKHPRSRKYTPQVIAKHHVTNQQLANALYTLTWTDAVSLPWQVQFRADCVVQHMKFKFIVKTIQTSESPQNCTVCRCTLEHLTYQISKARDPTGPFVSFTPLEVHQLDRHGYEMENKHLVSFLDLKPNTCYADVHQPVLDWEHVSSYPGTLDANELFNDDLYRYNQNNVVAVVGLKGFDCTLLLHNPMEKDVVIEGICIPGESIQSSLGVTKHKLTWKHPLAYRDWFCI